MQPTPQPASGGMPVPKLSSLALLAIAAIAIFLIAGIFGYILFLSRVPFDSQLWWMGVTSMIFALAFYLVYGATKDRRYARPLAGAFFLIGAGSFYASVFANPDPSGTKMTWLIVLSLLILIVLVAIFRMSRQTEMDAIRRSQRKLTP